MDGRGIGKAQLVKLCGLVFHFLAVEADGERAVLHVDSGDESNVAVEDFLGIVVLELQHAVAFAEGETGACEAVARGIDTLLNGDVEVVGSDDAALHGREHLDAAPRYVVGLGQAVADQIDDGRGNLVGLLALHEEEIGLLAVADVGHVSGIDGMGVHDDTTGLCLTENAGEAHHGNDTRIDDVAEHITRTDTRQLVHITNEQQTHVGRNGFQKGVHQYDVNH